jgi:hypothetical protein
MQSKHTPTTLHLFNVLKGKKCPSQPLSCCIKALLHAQNYLKYCVKIQCGYVYIVLYETMNSVLRLGSVHKISYYVYRNIPKSEKNVKHF